MSNTFVTPRSVTTLSQARVDYNNSLTALLQNFASPGAPGASAVNMEGATGLKEGMFWFKSGSNTTLGQGRTLVYRNGQFVRDVVYTTATAVSANVAASNGNLLVGDLVDIGDNRLYRVHNSGQYIVDVGIPPVGYTIGNATLLDNLDSEQFLRSDAADTATQQLTFTHMLNLSNSTATSTSAAALWLSASAGALMIDNTGQKRIAWSDGGSSLGVYSGSYYNSGAHKYTTTLDGAAQMLMDTDSVHGIVTIRVADRGTAEATPVWKQTLRLTNTAFTINSNTIWHAGNDGASSGLDADLLDGTQLVTIQNAYAANDGVTINSASANDGVTLATAQGNDHSTLLTARSNDWTTWGSAQGNDHATLLTARANDFSTWNTLTINTGSTLNSARANDWATWVSAQGNDHSTLLTARANDLATFTNATANDFNTFNTSRANDWTTWASAQGNDHATLLTARSNDWTTWASAQGNDHSTLLTAYANDLATFNTLTVNTFATWNTLSALKANSNTTFLTDASNIDNIPNGLYNWTSGASAPVGALYTDAVLLQANSGSEAGTSIESQLIFSNTGLATRTAFSGVWGPWQEFLRKDVNESTTGDFSAGRLILGAGSAATPVIAFAGSPGTGIYQAATNQIGFSTSGNTAATITINGNLRLFDTSGTYYTQLGNQPTGNRTIDIPDLSGTMQLSTQTHVFEESDAWGTGRARFGRNENQFVTFRGNSTASYLEARSEALGAGNYKDFIIRLSNTGGTTRTFTFGSTEGNFSARTFSTNSGDFSVATGGTITAARLETTNSGSAGSPTITIGDEDTGIYRETTGGRLAFTVNGSRVANCNATAFRIDPDTNLQSLKAYNSTTGTAANMVVQTDGNFARSTSSIKYKRDVETMQDNYADTIIDKVRSVFYRSKSNQDNPSWGFWGIIAEELHEIDPRLVSYKVNEDGSLEPEGVQYDRFVPHLINVVRRQKATITELLQKVDAIEARLQTLESA